MSKKDWRHKPHEINLIQAGKILDGEPIAVLDSGKLYIPDTTHKTVLGKWGKELFLEQGGMAVCPILKTVMLNRKSAKDTFGHGNYDKNKVMVLYVVKDIIEKGVLVAEDFSLEDESSHWKSAPLLIDNREYIATVLIHNDINIQRMYLHSVTAKERLLVQKTPPTPRVSIAFEDNQSTTLNGSLKSASTVNLQQQSPKVNRISQKHPNALTSDDIKQILQTALRLNRDKSFCQQFLQQQNI